MKRELHRGSHSVAEEQIHYRCENDSGEKFNQSDPPPSAIVSEIHCAIGRRQRSGVVYGRGERWMWSALPEDTIILAFTRHGEIEIQVEIPKTSWSAFKLCAFRRSVDAREWLSFLLGEALSRGVGIEEMCQWLFSTADQEPPSEEIVRFEQAQQEFHGEGVTV